MLSSTHKPPSLLFAVHCFASSQRVFHITRKQTNSTSPVCCSPSRQLQKAEILPPALGYGVFFSDGAFLFLFLLFVDWFCWGFWLRVSFLNSFRFITCSYRVRHREHCTLWPHFLFLLFSSSADPSSRQH